MNKGDTILKLLLEIKLELKEVKEQVEQMQVTLATFKPQNQVKSKVEQKKQKTKINADKTDKRNWKYPAKMK
ncbi:hypothetical protein [Bacillus thuringiensis]|uniref:hypothetical protein n=1 Tax=Bacillus thuringiensis TaxID=1428 RepID=UPI003B986FF5